MQLTAECAEIAELYRLLYALRVLGGKDPLLQKLTQINFREWRAIKRLAFADQWLGQIEAHLRREVRACFRTRIEAGALLARFDDQIGIALEARRQRPFHFVGIVDVDVLIDDEDVLA